MLKRLALGVIMLFTLAFAASAQVRTRDKVQLGLSGYGMFGGGISMMNTGVSMTRFFTEALEIGGDLNGTYSKTEGSDARNEMSVYGRIRYNFIGSSMTVPFLSAGAGKSLAKDATDVMIVGGAGFKHFVSERVSFNGEAYKIWAKNAEGRYEMAKPTIITFGLSIYIGQ